MAPGLLGLGRRQGWTRGRRLRRASLRLARSAPLLAPALPCRLPLRLLSLLALPLRLVARPRAALAAPLNRSKSRSLTRARLFALPAKSYRSRAFPPFDPRRFSAAPPRSTASAASV